MVKAKDLVGKTYTDAYSSLGLESYLDSKTGHHLIRDVPEAETVLGIYEAFQPEYNTPTLTHKYSRLKTLAECISDKFNNFRHSKTAAVLAAGSIVTAGAISAIAKDLMPHHPGIIMDATADAPQLTLSGGKEFANPNGDTDTHNLGGSSIEIVTGNGGVINYKDLRIDIENSTGTKIWSGNIENATYVDNYAPYYAFDLGKGEYDSNIDETSEPVKLNTEISGYEFGTIQNTRVVVLDNDDTDTIDAGDTILIFNSYNGDLIRDLPDYYTVTINYKSTTLGGVTNQGEHIQTNTNYDLLQTNAPTFIFGGGEKFFPANPYGDGDRNVANNYANWRSDNWGEVGLQPDEIYYHVTDYSNKTSMEHPEGYKVLQYWSYYVYNDWGFDQHQFDWEVIHKWVDNKSREVFYTSSSMHLWDNKYDGNINKFTVEEGGHGMSKDGELAGSIQVVTNGVGYISAYGPDDGFDETSNYELWPLEDLQEYAANDFPGERGKFPTDQERFKDPDKAIRLSNSLETIVSEFKIKNSPELLVIADGKATGFRDGRVIEDIPMSNYIENEERIIIIGDHKDIEVVLTGTENEKYELEGRTYNNGVEKTFTNKGTIRDNEIKKLDVTDTETPNADNESPNYTQLMVAAAIGGGALPILYLVRNKKSEKVDSSNKPKPEVINSNLKTTQISDLMNKHKKSKDAKTKRTNLPEECLEEEGQRKAISFADFSDE